MIVRRAVARTSIGLAAVLGCLVACNAIVGVEDVALKRPQTPGEDASVVEEDATSPVDAAVDVTRPNRLEVAPGEVHTCARRPDGNVKCWGDDVQGQTGTGGVDGGILRAPTSVKDVADAIAIASGGKHTCVVRGSGKVSCWGFNLDGQLGNGQTNARALAPVDVAGLADATTIAAGGNFSCAIRTGGSVVCWGGGLSGQLGNGANATRPQATPVTNLNDALAIATGESHACAVRSAGRVVCWGDGATGQLGTGTTAPSNVPVIVPGLEGVVGIAAGARHTCALRATGQVSCWGANGHGQLGNGAPNATPNATPVVVTSLEDATAVAAGATHSCAVRKSGGVACWGGGGSGQLGDGTARPDASTPTPTPVVVQGLAAAATGLGAGAEHSCAALASGQIACWGSNARGQIGIPSAITPQPAPVNVTGYP